jgi:Sec-independent protein translocase protein TatA
MFFDIGGGEFIGLAILGLILVGPERLPKLMLQLSNSGRTLGQDLRTCSRQI